MAVRKREDEVFPNAAGIDVGGSSHWVAVPPRMAEESVREFGAMTDDLYAMADWLLACGVDTVALESTGVYWIPVFEVLEQRGLKVWLVDARQMKYVPGRKSDVQDCQWLQRLMSLGFLRAAWRPTGEVCVVRAVARQRDVLLADQASWVQRMQKALVQMNIQLTEVLTDVMGMTGQLIIRDIVAGVRDPKVLARHRNRRVKASAEEITKALTGNWRDEHLFVLRQSLAMYDDIAGHLAECDRKLQTLLSELGQRNVDLGKVPRAGTTKGDDGGGKVVEGDEAALEFLVAHEQLAEAVEPAMADVDDPASCLLGRIAPLDVGFGTSTNDVRDVAVALDGAKVLGSTVARVGAQMFVSPIWRILAPDDDGCEHVVKPHAVMDVGPCHDERQRDATGVHQQVALASFFPRSVGLGPTASCASGAFIIAPSMLCQRQAMPCIWSYSAKPAFQRASKNPAASHSRNRLWMALALPKRSLGSAFHWQPVRST